MFFKSTKTAAKAAGPLILTKAPAPGIFVGTAIATPHAWTPIEDLQVGDEVLTVEHGSQVIRRVETGRLSVAATKAAAAQWPLLIPEGALGNTHAMMVAPGLHIVVEDDVITELFGKDCVSVRAQYLIGFRGIARARVSKPVHHVTLVFDAPEALVIEGEMFFDIADVSGAQCFPCLDDREARLLARHIDEMDRKEKVVPVKTGWI